LIVEEAGGIFTDLEGQPVALGTTSVLAANRRLYPELATLLGVPRA
jgi:fructose-1,6-bisphosphatase/inositol monophosphatase family enzyme